MKRKKKCNLIVYIILIICCYITNFPIMAMIGTAFKPRNETLSTLTLFSSNMTLENFVHVFKKTSFGQNLVNTIIVAAIVTVMCVCLSSVAGYALSRAKNKFFSIYTIFLLILQMLPSMLVLIPLYIMLSGLHLVDSLFSLVLLYTALNLPFGIWTLKGFFDSIPYELDEAAMIDGCTEFQAYYMIIFPYSLPGIVSVSVFTLMNVWNEYTIASIFIQNKDLRTLSVGLRQFMMQNSTDWASMNAAATIAIIPAVILVLFAQKYLVSGLTSGSIKG